MKSCKCSKTEVHRELANFKRRTSKNPGTRSDDEEKLIVIE